MTAAPVLVSRSESLQEAAGARVGAAARRVLHVVLSLDPGGTEQLVIEICRRAPAHIAPIVCCLDDAGAWAPRLTAKGVPVIALRRRPGFHPSIGWQVARIAAEHGATLIHCHHYSPFVYSCLAGARRRSMKLVFTEHGRLSDAPPSLKRRVANLVLSHAGAVVCSVSDDLRGFLVREGFASSDVRVVYNGIDPGSVATASARTAARIALNLHLDGFVIGAIARLDPVKDLQTLLEAKVGMRERAEIVVIGDGPERAALQQRAAALGVERFVHFVGHRDDARRLLPAFDVYVNCSTHEGVSLTILEAMAAALPVVATRVGGTPEVVVHQDTGILIPARNPGALAAALDALAVSRDRRARLGAAGRRRVEQQFTIDRMVADYVRIYEQLEAN